MNIGLLESEVPFYSFFFFWKSDLFNLCWVLPSICKITPDYVENLGSFLWILCVTNFCKIVIFHKHFRRTRLCHISKTQTLKLVIFRLLHFGDLYKRDVTLWVDIFFILISKTENKNRKENTFVNWRIFEYWCFFVIFNFQYCNQNNDWSTLMWQMNLRLV